MCDCAAFEFACVCMSKLAPGPYWYLECDWQRRSLLGEIVNRVEPVICSRQPWKGKADSQGSYWGFQRCCMSDLGPGPSRTDPASRAFFFFFSSNPRWSMCCRILSFVTRAFSQHPFFVFLTLFLLPPALLTTLSLSLFLLCKVGVFVNLQHKLRLSLCSAFFFSNTPETLLTLGTT